MTTNYHLDRFRATADSIRAPLNRDALAGTRFLVLLDELSVCDLFSTLAGRQTLSSCHVAAGGSFAAKFVLGTRLGLVKRLVILFVILVLSFRLHLLGVGFALALVLVWAFDYGECSVGAALGIIAATLIHDVDPVSGGVHGRSDWTQTHTQQAGRIGSAIDHGDRS